jgi:hypothetical protein
MLINYELECQILRNMGDEEGRNGDNQPECQLAPHLVMRVAPMQMA